MKIQELLEGRGKQKKPLKIPGPRTDKWVEHPSQEEIDIYVELIVEWFHHNYNRFSWMGRQEEVPNQAGYRRKLEGDTWEFFVTPIIITNEIFAFCSHKNKTPRSSILRTAVMQELIKLGFLIPDTTKDKNSFSVNGRVPQYINKLNNARFYHFKLTIPNIPDIETRIAIPLRSKPKNTKPGTSPDWTKSVLAHIPLGGRTKYLYDLLIKIISEHNNPMLISNIKEILKKDYNIDFSSSEGARLETILHHFNNMYPQQKKLELLPKKKEGIKKSYLYTHIALV